MLFLMLAILIIVLLAALESEREKAFLKVEHYEICTEKPGKELRILFLCDLHSCRFGTGNSRLLEAVAKERPDLILLGGDMLKVGHSLPVEQEQEDALRALLTELRKFALVMYAPGNHELRLEEIQPQQYASFSALLKELGIPYLKDAAADLQDVRVFGIGLDREYYRHFFPGFGKKANMPPDFIEQRMKQPEGEANADPFRILLLHSPLYLKEAALAGADLVLSGHFHGGTIRLPDGRGLMTPQYQFLVKECSGMHRFQNCIMIVNRGLGTHSIRIRLNNLPEISVIDLKRRPMQAADGN